MPVPNVAFKDTTDDLSSPASALSGQANNLPLDPFDINLNATAQAWYGYVGETGGKLFEGNPSVAQDTHEAYNSPTGKTVSGPQFHNAVGHRNPLFWFLVIVLIFVGYLGFGFDFKLKKLGKAGARVGK